MMKRGGSGAGPGDLPPLPGPQGPDPGRPGDRPPGMAHETLDDQERHRARRQALHVVEIAGRFGQSPASKPLHHPLAVTDTDGIR